MKNKKLKIIKYRTRASVIAALLCMGLALSGCGTKDPERITGYGGDTAGSTSAESKSETGSEGSGQNGTEGSTGESTEGNGGQLDRDAAIASAEAKSNQSLREKLGGEKVTWQDAFSIGKLPVTVDVQYEVPDISALPSFLAKTPEAKRIPEAEVVQTIFGDTATEVKRTLSQTKGDSERIQGVCYGAYCEFYPDSSGTENSEGVPDCSGWEDVGDYFYHTYEGKYNDIDYQLVIGLREDSQMIVLYPKNPGDLVGRPECSKVVIADNGIVHVVDPNDRTRDYELSTELLEDPNNRAKDEESTQLAAAQNFVRDKLKVNLPDDTIAFERTWTEYGDSPDGSITFDESQAGRRELVFVDTTTVSENSLGRAVMNGYQAHLSYYLSGLPYEVVFETSSSNIGSLWVTDDGVVGAEIYMNYDFEEKLSDNVALLSFENAMASFKNGVTENLDMTKVTGNSLTVNYAELSYYPIPSPDKKGEVTFAPAWMISLYSNGFEIGCAIVNAMDGSLIEIRYTADMNNGG